MQRHAGRLIVVLGVSACGSPTRYVLAPRPAAADVSSSRACIDACRDGREPSPPNVERAPAYDYDCLAHCRGVTIEHGACDDPQAGKPDQTSTPADAFCVERRPHGIWRELAAAVVVLALACAAVTLVAQ